MTPMFSIDKERNKNNTIGILLLRGTNKQNIQGEITSKRGRLLVGMVSQIIPLLFFNLHKQQFIKVCLPRNSKQDKPRNIQYFAP